MLSSTDLYSSEDSEYEVAPVPNATCTCEDGLGHIAAAIAVDV